jgi:ribosomal protein L11 methyltransferase
LIRLALRVAGEQAELALAELLELAPGGVEERELADGSVEYAIYGAPGELPALPHLRAAAGSALVEVSTSELADDWAERWRRFHRPVLIEPRSPAPALYVRPPWESACAREDALDVVIDPGRAFGTGSHASTRLCLELMLELAAAEPPGALVDLGTGSGVLAIAAARLGYEPVIALDNDPASVYAAQENALRNGVTIAVRRFELRREELPLVGKAATRRDGQQIVAEMDATEVVVAANLLAPLLMSLALKLPAAPAHLLAGGLLAAEADELVAAFTSRLPLRERARRVRGDWAALWLSRAEEAA